MSRELQVMLESNGFFRADRTLKRQEHCAKKQKIQILPFSQHSVSIHKPWAPWLIKTNGNLSEAYSMWCRAQSAVAEHKDCVWLAPLLQLFSSNVIYTKDFWLSTIPPLTGTKADHFLPSVLQMLQSCSTFRVGKQSLYCFTITYQRKQTKTALTFTGSSWWLFQLDVYIYIYLIYI